MTSPYKYILILVALLTVSSIKSQINTEILLEQASTLLVKQDSLTEQLMTVALGDSIYSNEERHEAVAILGTFNTPKANHFLLKHIDKMITLEELIDDVDQIREWAFFTALTSQSQLESFPLYLIVEELKQEKNEKQLNFYAILF